MIPRYAYLQIEFYIIFGLAQINFIKILKFTHGLTNIPRTLQRINLNKKFEQHDFWHIIPAILILDFEKVLTFYRH